ncbi:hypothetical protein WLZ34_01525 [Thermogladius sp. KZ2Tp1]|uniref:hypothetical protein n=1 Tax=Thermogladius sp. KZ2Tp1 TaxID=3136289 RepID=UPI003DA90CEE
MLLGGLANFISFKAGILFGNCGMSSRCLGSCVIEGPGEGPPLPEGMDFSNLEGLCYEIEGVPGFAGEGEHRPLGEGELDFAGEDIYRSLERLPEIRVVEGSCDARRWGSIACTETLAVCSKTPCSAESSARADAPAIYYNIDRIRSWVRKHALNNLAFIFKQCLEIDRPHDYERLLRDPFLIDLVKNVYLATEETALAYLQVHERAHCVGGIMDEGKATALGLYEAFKRYIFDKEQLRRGHAYKLIPIESILASYLTILRIAYHHYQMPGYRDFVKYVKLPLVMPRCRGLDAVLIEYYKGWTLHYRIIVHPGRLFIKWPGVRIIIDEISKETPLDYRGTRPSRRLGPRDCGLYEVWAPCDGTTWVSPQYPTP